jgi:hypothetical protein
MTGFVANTAPAEETTIENIPFFPDVSPVACRDVMRIDSSITPDRLRAALVSAMHDTNHDLRHFRAEQEAAGYATLGDVPADAIDGSNINVQLYQRAVYNIAKAELTERYRDYDTTLHGTQRAEDLDETIDTYRRQAILAIRKIAGRQRTTVELI